MTNEELKKKIEMLRGQGNQTDLGGVLADILDELSENSGGTKKLTITGFIPDEGETFEEEQLARNLGIEVSELRALCDGEYDVLAEEVSESRKEYRQEMTELDAIGCSTAYFIAELQPLRYMGITKMYDNGVYTYSAFYI